MKFGFLPRSYVSNALKVAFDTSDAIKEAFSFTSSEIFHTRWTALFFAKRPKSSPLCLSKIHRTNCAVIMMLPDISFFTFHVLRVFVSLSIAQLQLWNQWGAALATSHIHHRLPHTPMKACKLTNQLWKKSLTIEHAREICIDLASCLAIPHLTWVPNIFVR